MKIVQVIFYAQRALCYISSVTGKTGFAIASMVLGIISIVCCCISYFALVCAVAAIVFFIVDYKINKKASGMAIAGLICGIFGVLIGAFSIISDIIFRDDIESIWSSILGDIGSDVTQL